MPNIIDETEAKNRDNDAARRDEWARKAEDQKSRRAEIERGLETAYRDAEVEEGVEESLDVQRKVAERFGASAGDVLAHFKRLDDEMRRNPVEGLAQAEDFFLKAGQPPVTKWKDLKPAAARDLDQRLSELSTGNDLRADIAKSYARTLERQEASTRLKDAAKTIRGPVKNALQRILDVVELGSKDPRLAAAQWFAQSGFPSKSDLDRPEPPQQEVHRALDHLLETDFRDLEPHVDKITAWVSSGKLIPSGDLRQDMKNARKLLNGRA